MRTRYLYAVMGYVLGLGLALLSCFLLQTDSGRTIQLHLSDVANIIYTTSWCRTETALLTFVLGGVGLIAGYSLGMRAEGPSAAQDAEGPSRWRDLGRVLLLAALSSPLKGRVLPFLGGAIDLPQAALVATAALFGPGPALLAGGPGIAMGTALGSGPWWLPFVLGAFGGLQGLAVARLATRTRLVLLGMVLAATVIGLFPYLLLSAALALPMENIEASTMGLRVLLGAVLGVVITVLVRGLRPRGKPVRRDPQAPSTERNGPTRGA